ncbi:MAG: translation initiation factor IF-3 [Candidatus Oxydemutatoraceae bacterium WSBS_2016_MAG_OTU14]
MNLIKKLRLNEAITSQQVRLIDHTGENKGVINLDEAKKIALSHDLDLVEIVPDSEPPVCRIMDYGKFRFDKEKKTQQARKNQKRFQVKEIKFRLGTEEADYQTKLRNLIKFLKQGDKTKITIRFRGREILHQDRGRVLLDRICQDLIEWGEIEQEAISEGRQLIMILAPNRGQNKKKIVQPQTQVEQTIEQ